MCYCHHFDPQDCHGLFRLGVCAISVQKNTEGKKVMREVYEEVIA